MSYAFLLRFSNSSKPIRNQSLLYRRHSWHVHFALVGLVREDTRYLLWCRFNYNLHLFAIQYGLCLLALLLPVNSSNVPVASKQKFELRIWLTLLNLHLYFPPVCKHNGLGSQRLSYQNPMRVGEYCLLKSMCRLKRLNWSAASGTQKWSGN